MNQTLRMSLDNSIEPIIFASRSGQSTQSKQEVNIFNDSGALPAMPTFGPRRSVMSPDRALEEIQSKYKSHVDDEDDMVDEINLSSGRRRRRSRSPVVQHAPKQLAQESTPVMFKRMLEASMKE